MENKTKNKEDKKMQRETILITVARAINKYYDSNRFVDGMFWQKVVTYFCEEFGMNW